MAEIILNKPATGAQDIVNAQPDARLLLDFPAGDATLERVGDDLIFRFGDGSSLVLRDFYNAYSKENMPDFVIDGTPISGEEFFAALNNEDLMPAAGPSASNADGGRYREYTDDPLQVGVDRLGGLDLSSDRAFYPERDPWGGLDDGSSSGPNREPILQISGSIGVIEAGVRPGGNDAYEGVPLMSGRVEATDDDGDLLAYGFIDAAGNRVTAIDAEHGSIVMAQDGTYTYTLDNNDPDTNRLALGETATETFTVFVDDGRGGFITQQVTVTITGTNDRPELSVTGSGQDVVEDGTQSVTGTVTVADPDSDAGTDQTFHIDGANGGTGTDGSRTENGSTEATFATDYGKLVLNPETGTWEYTLDNTSDAVQKLGEGETRTETFTVTVTDEHGATSQQTITVTITGTNDVPIVDGHTEALTLKEAGVGPDGGDPNAPVAGVSTASGTVEAHDVDANDPDLTYSLAAGENTAIISSGTDPDTGVQTIVTQYGTLVLTPGSLTADGKPSYTYTLDQGLADTLNAGQTHNEHFVLTVADGHGGTADVPINVTIEGTNDRPLLTIDKPDHTLIEDDAISTVSGTFTVTDRDADGAFNGQTDGVGNQRYSIAGGTAADGDVTTGTGTPSPDAGGPATFTTEYGTLTVNPDGTWTYELDKDSETLHALKEGETRTETFDVTVTDAHGANHTQPITVTITGTNDAPTIKPVTEHVKDTGVFGGGEVSPNTGTDDYTGPDADGHIKDAEHRLDVTGQLQGFDAEGAGLTYGVNTDGMAAGGTLTLTNPADPAETATIKVTSVSTDAAGTTSIVTEAGTLVVGPDGSYKFTLDATEGGFVDGMAQGEKWNLTFDVTASDGDLTGHGALTICIEGTNEIPTFTQLAHRDYTGQDQTPIDAEGKWVVEAAEQGRWQGNGDGSNRISDHSDVLTGSFGADDRDNGESANLTFGAEFKDGTTSGSNKGALEALGKMELTREPEDLVLAEPRPLAEHPDKGSDNYTELAPGNYKVFHFDVGDFYLNVGTGDYYFDLNDDSDLVNRMNLGDTHSLNFNITVTDEHGASSSHDFTINISGRNDRPELTVNDGISTTDGQTATGSLNDLVDVKDADFGDSHTFYIVANPTMGGNYPGDYEGSKDDFASNKLENYHPVTTPLEGKYGVLTVNQDGSYEYKLYGPGEGHDDAYNAMKSLPEGGTLDDEVFHIAVQDKNGAFDIKELPITITGVNDAPVIKKAGNLTLKETGVHDANTPTVEDTGDTLDGNEHKLTATGKVDASDVDSGDEITYYLKDADGNPVTSIQTKYGTVSIDSKTGEYTYELNDGAVDHLAQGQTQPDSFTVIVSDRLGATDEQKVDVTIHGTNDQPTLTLPKVDGKEQDAFTVTEAVNTGEYGGTFDKQAHELGKVTREDADDGHTLEFGLAKGSHPEVTEGAAPESVIFKEQGSVTIEGEYGNLTIDKDGNLSYKVDNKPGSKADLLDEGEHGEDTFTIYVRDEHGAWTARPITITVNGVNDPPRMVEGGGVEVTESGVVDGNKPNNALDESDGQFKKVVDSEGDTLSYAISGVRQNTTRPGEHLAQGDDGYREGYDCYKVDEGILYINKSDGTFTFKLDNDYARINELNAGEKLALKFNVKVTDEHGASMDTWLTVTITGANDRPDLTLVSGDSGVENGWSIVADEAGNASISMTEGETAKGTVSVTDPDMGGKQGETFTFAVDKGEKGGNDQQNGDLSAALKNNGTVDGDYGTLTVDPKTGEYTYTAHENLAEGHTYTETFTVFVKDANGAWDAQTVTVQVTGSADAPVIKGDLPRADVVEYTEAGVEFDKNVDKEDSISGAGTSKAADGSFILGTFEAQQTDTADGAGQLVAGFVVDGKFYANQMETPYGTLKITIDGEGTATYSFLPPKEGTPEAANLDRLTEADRIKLFEDLGGLKVGVYDTAHAGLVQKDAGHDDGGDYFTINPANGQLIPTQDVDFYIHGTNDRPYFTDGDGNRVGEFTAGTGTLVENGDGVLNGQLAADDPDGNHNPGDLSFSIVLDGKLVQVAEGKYGILELREDGSYTYTITKPELLESLNPGQSLIDSALANEIFDIRVTDPLKASTDGKLTIDMTGSADAPTITAGKLEVREDNGKNDAELPGSDVTCSGRLGLDGIVDAEDKGDVTWKDITEPTDDAYGTLTVNPDGTYTYTLTKNGETVIQQLNEGDTLTQTFRVQAVIEGGKTVEKDITVTIRGTNDRPVLDAEQTTFEGEVTRDVFDDKDPTDMGAGVNTGVIFKGKLDMEGVTDVDDDAEKLQYMLVVERDADGNPTAFGTELKTPYGTIELHEDGTYTYTLDNESRALIDALEKNPEGLLDEVGIVAVDPHGAVSKDEGTITIKINPGKEDGTGPYDVVIDKSNPELNATVTEDGKEDNALTPVNEDSTVSGQIKAVWGENSVHEPGTPAPNLVFGIHDGNGQQVQGSVNGEYGYLVINPATGEYVYTLYNGENGVSNPVQDLAAGETKEESFEIMLNGKPTGEKLTITIHGTNDAPVITNVTQSSDRLTEDATNGWAGKEVTGTVRGTDIDHFRKEDGTFDDTKTETVTYKFNTADNVEGSYDEDGNLVSQTLTIAGKGTVVLNTITGDYTFTVDPGLGHIVAGDSAKVNFQIVATDGKDDSKPADITINLDGVNHAPELKDGGLTINVTEDDAVTASGDLKSLVNDDRNGEGLTFTVDGKTVMQGEYGTLVINKDGTYTYTLNNADDAVQGLDDNHPGKDTFTIKVDDGEGGTAEIKVNVTVTGKDDIPHVTVGEVIKATEGSETVYEGQVIAYDKDAADKEPGALKYTFDEKNLDEHPAWTLNADGSLTTEYGTYAIGADGKYTFTLDNESDAVRGLAAGTLTEQKVTVVVTDSQGNRVTQEVTVNISGQNTAPDFMDGDGNRLTPDAEGNLTLEASTADTPLVEAEGTGTTSSIEGNFGLADPDADGSVKGFTVNGTAITGQTVIHGKYGDLTINPDGSYTYTYTSDSLGAGETDSDSFEIVATDNHGATSEAQLVVNLEGTNDAPVITAAPNLNTKEGDADVTGQVEFTDADKDDTHTFAVKYGEGAEGTTATGNYGTLTIGKDGKYTYEVTNHELGADESAMETFTVIVKDNHGGEDARTVTVIVKGTNDAPVIEMATAPGADGDGSFIFSDADKNDTHSLSVLIDGKAHDVALDDEGTAGTCTVDGVGTFAFTFTSATEGQKDWSYTFEPDKALTDTLRPGQSGEIGFQIQVSDGLVSVPSGDLSVSFTGTNDAPVISAEAEGAAGTLAVMDGDLLSLAVLGKDGEEIARLDLTNEGPQAVDIDGHTVTFTRQAGGSYSYELDGGNVHMGGKAEVSFSIQATDHLGSVTTENPVTLVADGTQNDAPTASGDAQGLSLPSMLIPPQPGGEVPTIDGRLTDSDPDGDSLTYAAGTLPGSYGELSLNEDGSYTYALDMSGDNLAHLVTQRGEALTETFTYTVSDAHGGASEGSITVTLSVPEDFSTVTSRGAARSLYQADNDDAAQTSGEDALHNTDGLGGHDAGNDADGSFHAQSALSAHGADPLHGASLFTADGFGDQDIFGPGAYDGFAAMSGNETFYGDTESLAQAGQLLEAPGNSLDGVLVPSQGTADGQDDLGLAGLQPGPDLGGAAMPGLVPAESAADSADAAIVAGAPLPGAEDNLAHHQAMHDVNHSNG